MDICRVCLSTENEMVPLNESVLSTYNLLTGLNIALLDGMPQYTCPTCKETIGFFAEFREKCIASEATLRELTESKYDTKITTISKEISTTVQLDTNTDNIVKTEIEIKAEKCDFISDEIAFECDDYDARISPECVPDKEFKRTKRKYKKRNKSPVIDIPEVETDSKLFCGLCPKSFDCSTKMKDHVESHSGDMSCGLCFYPLVNKPQCFAHRIMHVPRTQNKCHICLKKYRSQFYLEYHLRNTHFQSEGSKMSCNLCSSTFSIPQKYASHQHVHGAPNFVCDYCNKTFHWKSQLISHIGIHAMNINKPYVCDVCGFSCRHPSGLSNHKLRRHDPNKVYCKICGQAFRSQEIYSKHKCPRKHPGICPVCGKQLKKQRGMARHLRSHSNEKKYECDRCPAKYKTKGALIVHKNRHDGNRTIQCPICPAKFYSASVLIKHRRIHTGEKPYVCDICNKGFTGGHNLKVHMKVHGLNLVVKKNIEIEVPSFLAQK